MTALPTLEERLAQVTRERDEARKVVALVADYQRKFTYLRGLLIAKYKRVGNSRGTKAERAAIEAATDAVENARCLLDPHAVMIGAREHIDGLCDEAWS